MQAVGLHLHTHHVLLNCAHAWLVTPSLVRPRPRARVTAAAAQVLHRPGRQPGCRRHARGGGPAHRRARLPPLLQGPLGALVPRDRRPCLIQRSCRGAQQKRLPSAVLPASVRVMELRFSPGSTAWHRLCQGLVARPVHASEPAPHCAVEHRNTLCHAAGERRQVQWRTICSCDPVRAMEARAVSGPPVRRSMSARRAAFGGASTRRACWSCPAAGARAAGPRCWRCTCAGRPSCGTRRAPGPAGRRRRARAHAMIGMRGARIERGFGCLLCWQAARWRCPCCVAALLQVLGCARGVPAPCCADGGPGTGMQVRCIAAVLLLVGRGLEAPGVVARLLDTSGQPGKPQYCLAPEVGRAEHATVSMFGREYSRGCMGGQPGELLPCRACEQGSYSAGAAA